MNLDLEASAGSGDVDSDLHMTVTGTVSSSSLRATLGKGGELLRLHTSGGDITFDRCELAGRRGVLLPQALSR